MQRFPANTDFTLSSRTLPYGEGREDAVPHENRCAVPGRAAEPRELRRRIRKLAEELRMHDIEEGYEWPCSERPEQEESSDLERA